MSADWNSVYPALRMRFHKDDRVPVLLGYAEYTTNSKVRAKRAEWVETPAQGF